MSDSLGSTGATRHLHFKRVVVGQELIWIDHQFLQTHKMMSTIDRGRNDNVRLDCQDRNRACSRCDEDRRARSTSRRSSSHVHRRRRCDHAIATRRAPVMSNNK